jgi:exosortase
LAASTLGLLLAVGIFGWAHYVSSPILTVVSLVAALAAGCGFTAGGGFLRAALLPILFLLFAAPLPSVVVNHIVLPMQLNAGQLAHGLLGLIGIDSRLSGDLIFSRGHVFQVIETCSGLRSFVTLTMASVLYVELFGRRSRQGWLLIAAAPLIAYLLNGLRIVAIVLAPGSGFAEEHVTQGLVAVVLGVLAIDGLDRVLTRLLPESWRRRRTPPEIPPATTAPAPMRLRLALLAACLLAAWSHFGPQWSAPPQPLENLAKLVGKIDGWTPRALPTDRQFMGTVRFSNSMSRRYSNGRDSVDVFIGVDHRFEPGASSLSPKTARPGAGWRRIAADEPLASPLEAGAQMDAQVYARDDQLVLVLHQRHAMASFGVELVHELLGIDHSPFRRPGSALVVRLATPTGPLPPSKASWRRLETFAAAIQERIRKRGAQVL